MSQTIREGEDQLTAMAPYDVRTGTVDLEPAAVPEVAGGLDAMAATPRDRLVLCRTRRTRRGDLGHAQDAQCCGGRARRGSA